MNAPAKASRLLGHLPLQLIFIIPFILQIVLIVGITGYISFRNGQQAVDTLVHALQEETSQRIEEELTGHLETPHLVNKLQAHALRSGQLDLSQPAELTPYFWQYLQLFPELNATFLGTAVGEMVGARRLTDRLEVMLASEQTEQRLAYYLPTKDGGIGAWQSGLPDAYDPRQRSWYGTAVDAQAPRWSNIYLDFETGKPVITAGEPVYDENGQLIGVLGSAFQFEQFSHFLQELEIGQTGQTFIIDHDGLLISSSTLSPITQETDGQLSRLPAAASADPVISTIAQFLAVNYGGWANVDENLNLVVPINGEPHYVRITPIHDEFGLDWLLTIVIPSRDFTQEIEANRQLTLFSIVVSLVGAIFIGVVTTQWVTHPLLSLRDAAEDFSAGNWQRRMNKYTDRHDELGLVARTFNQMADALESSFATLQQSQARYESIFHNVPIMLLEADYTECQRRVAALKQDAGHVMIYGAYWQAHPEALLYCAEGVEFTAVNQTVADFFPNLPPNQVLTALNQFSHERNYPILQQTIVAFATGQTSFAADFPVTLPDGQTRYLSGAAFLGAGV
jgi:adenylate cyclase